MPTTARSAHLPRHLLDIHAIHLSRFTAIMFTALATFPWAPGQRSRRVSLLGGAGRAHFAWLLLLIEVEGCWEAAAHALGVLPFALPVFFPPSYPTTYAPAGEIDIDPEEKNVRWMWNARGDPPSSFARPSPGSRALHVPPLLWLRVSFASPSLYAYPPARTSSVPHTLAPALLRLPGVCDTCERTKTREYSRGSTWGMEMEDGGERKQVLEVERSRKGSDGVKAGWRRRTGMARAPDAQGVGVGAPSARGSYGYLRTTAGPTCASLGRCHVTSTTRRLLNVAAASSAGRHYQRISEVYLLEHNLAAAPYIPLRISRSFASPTAACPHASIPPPPPHSISALRTAGTVSRAARRSVRPVYLLALLVSHIQTCPPYVGGTWGEGRFTALAFEWREGGLACRGVARTALGLLVVLVGDTPRWTDLRVGRRYHWYGVGVIGETAATGCEVFGQQEGGET
ncbi:hypothetical protein DFH08DRAFT_940803 [Mycena albidolilacea]|uniref:Uncharacterized protein n=1 Tax=Mycena albidolilacea TaxID=1033008 RepID=A0AAD7EIN1_9AGAR|nr:hypothetical protein DFH08DRAFT_940803 [Mycena albidolilacea]